MIINKTKNFVIAEKHFDCYSLFCKARGLMFSGKKALVFYFSKQKRISLHMWFVFFPIDVLFLDEQNRVIEIKRNFKPFGFYTSAREVASLIEIPSGKIKHTSVGDEIEIY